VSAVEPRRFGDAQLARDRRVEVLISSDVARK